MIHALYLDESGDFSSRRDPAILGGPLFTGPPDRRRDAAIRAALLADFPGLPWPLHAAELVRPLAPAGWLLRDYAIGDPDVGAAARSALDIVDAIDRAGEFRAQWARGARVGSEALSVAKRLEPILRRTAPATWATLARAAQARRDRIRHRTQAVARAASSSPVALVGAVAPPAPLDDPRPDREARWLGALQATIERACMLLDPGDQLVVFVSPFRGLKASTAAHQAAIGTEVGGPFVVSKVVRADDPPAGVVLADFLLFPAREATREAGHTRQSYAELDASMAARALPVSRPTARAEAPLPTLLVDDLGRELVRRRLAGAADAGARLPDVAPRWNREQAHAWLEAL
jgi:hypothetical protein